MFEEFQEYKTSSLSNIPLLIASKLLLRSALTQRPVPTDLSADAFAGEPDK